MLLGGEIRLTSVHGQGSCFTLYLPLHYSGPDGAPMSREGELAGEPQRTVIALPGVREEHIADDRDSIKDGDATLLVIEDDPHYARILLGLARDKGFKGLVAARPHIKRTIRM